MERQTLMAEGFHDKNLNGGFGSEVGSMGSWHLGDHNAQTWDEVMGRGSWHDLRPPPKPGSTRAQQVGERVMAWEPGCDLCTVPGLPCTCMCSQGLRGPVCWEFRLLCLLDLEGKDILCHRGSSWVKVATFDLGCPRGTQLWYLPGIQVQET